MALISYTDKVAIEELSGVPDINKVKDTDMNEIKSVVNSMFTLLGLDTDTYSSSSTYAVGDLVVYDNAIYECTTAITTAEAWNSAHWTLVPIFVDE